MKQWWDSNIKDRVSLERYDPLKHDKPIAGTLLIENCTMNSVLDVPSNKKLNVNFRNVHFTDSVTSLNSSILETIVFQDCIFYSIVALDFYQNISVRFHRCQNLNDNVQFFVHEVRKFEITNCAFNFTVIQVAKCQELRISKTYFNQLVISPVNNIIHINSPKSGVINTMYASFFVADKASIFAGLEFTNCSIIFEDLIDLEDVIRQPGELNVFGGDFINGVQINSYSTKTIVCPNLEDLPIIKKINIQFGSLNANHINISSCNIIDLTLTGKNKSVSSYILSCEVQCINFNTYEQSETGLVNFRGIINLKGQLNAISTLILNDRLFFQDSDFAQWTSSVSGSLLKHHALNCKLPLKPNSKLSTLQQLEVQNTWLFNTEKDSDIINYHDLKKEQWKLVWQKRKDEKSRLSFGEICQKFVQELNDYSTNWQKPICWLVIPNLFLSAIFITVGVACRNLETGIFTEYLEVLIACLVPLKWTSNPDYLFGLWLVVLFFLRIWNATLIYQIISAFRVYFKK